MNRSKYATFLRGGVVNNALVNVENGRPFASTCNYFPDFSQRDIGGQLKFFLHFEISFFNVSVFACKIHTSVLQRKRKDPGFF